MQHNHLLAPKVLVAASSEGISKGIPVWPPASHTLARGCRSGISQKQHEHQRTEGRGEEQEEEQQQQQI